MTEKQLVTLATALGCQLWFTSDTMELEPPIGEIAPQGTIERSARGRAYLQETLEKYQAVVHAMATVQGKGEDPSWDYSAD